MPFAAVKRKKSRWSWWWSKNNTSSSISSNQSISFLCFRFPFPHTSSSSLPSPMQKSPPSPLAQSLPPPQPPPPRTVEQHLQLPNSGNMSFSSTISRDDEDLSRSALSTFKAKEEEIEKKKLEVRDKVHAELGRVEVETKRLALIREELETLADPLKKELALVRKKIDSINRELKPLGQICQKKEKEYKEALDYYNDKNREKVALIGKLMELVGESEKSRMKKLDELSKSIDLLHRSEVNPTTTMTSS